MGSPLGDQQHWIDSFKWAELRRDTYPDCGLATSFQILCELAQINSDRAEVNNNGGNGSHFRTADLGEAFVVFRVQSFDGLENVAMVRLKLIPGLIEVSQRKHQSAKAEALFSAGNIKPHDGRCLLRVQRGATLDAEIIPLDQVVRMALFDLFKETF